MNEKQTPSPIKRRLQKCFALYQFIVLSVVNALLLLLLLNAVLAVAFWGKDNMMSDPVSLKYGYSSLSTVYPGMSQSEIESLLAETWSRPYDYEPFRQFREKAYQGKYVNVASNGFRLSEDQGVWPPSPECINIFIFGGSTTFGYGLSDQQTIASCLQRYLRSKSDRKICVYNFGQGNYYSRQERIYFEELISAGFVPDIALFVDGLNDFFRHTNEPALTEQFRDMMQNSHQFRGVGSAIEQSSVSRLVSGLKRWLQSSPSTSQPQTSQQSQSEFNDRSVIDSVVRRYLTNKKLTELIAEHFTCDTAFVWQPVPVYQYDLRLHPFSQNGMGDHRYAEFGYPVMKQQFDLGTLGDNMLWLADIQQDASEPLYVDQVHYTASFTEQLAGAIGDFVLSKFTHRFSK